VERFGCSFYERDLPKTALPGGDLIRRRRDPIREGKSHKYIASDDNPFGSLDDKGFTRISISKAVVFQYITIPT